MSDNLNSFDSKKDSDLQPFVDGIKKTGYPLESEIVQTLQDDGWKVISNKYYVDNDEEKPREVDVVAYKVNGSNSHYDVYTALIISCKKSEHSSWVFLTRDPNLKDSNSEWQPAHFVIPHPPLDFMAKRQKKWTSFYHEQAIARGVSEVLQLPSVEVFAVQEMSNYGKNTVAGKPSGDSQIFNSIMSLMKAQFYEMSVRRENVREKPGIYQFNLISVADARFIQLHFKNGEITPSAIDSEHYIARYIFNRKEIFARIFFVRSTKFANLLNDYDRLHVANCEIMKMQEEAFYHLVMEDHARVSVYQEEFSRKLSKAILYTCYAHEHFPKFEPEISLLWWNKAKSILEINATCTAEELEFLNGIECRRETAKFLKIFYRYEGKFCFVDDDIPF